MRDVLGVELLDLVVFVSVLVGEGSVFLIIGGSILVELLLKPGGRLELV